MLPLINGPLVYVDDDEDDHVLFRQAIEQLGLSIVIRAFGNGADALTYLETTTEQPLLILCDLSMPVMGGLELRSHIDESGYLRQKAIPFIYFTTLASPDQIRQAYRSNVQGFHVKAQEFGELKHQLELIITYWQSSLHPNSLT